MNSAVQTLQRRVQFSSKIQTIWFWFPIGLNEVGRIQNKYIQHLQPYIFIQFYIIVFIGHKRMRGQGVRDGSLPQSGKIFEISHSLLLQESAVSQAKMLVNDENLVWLPPPH